MSVAVNKKIDKHLRQQKLLFFASISLILLSMSLLVLINTYKNTHQIVKGTILSTYVNPTTRSLQSGYESSAQSSVMLPDYQTVNVSIPNKLIPQKGDVFIFEIHKSFLLERKKYVAIRKERNN